MIIARPYLCSKALCVDKLIPVECMQPIKSQSDRDMPSQLSSVCMTHDFHAQKFLMPNGLRKCKLQEQEKCHRNWGSVWSVEKVQICKIFRPPLT